jgi:P-type E1-E2 ATPase
MALVRGLQTIFNFATVGIDANNPRLTGDLCAISYIMSDKTGTLTKNEMVFQLLIDKHKKVFKVGKSPYEVLKFKVESSSQNVSDKADLDLLRCLGLCTTVLISDS